MTRRNPGPTPRATPAACLLALAAAALAAAPLPAAAQDMTIDVSVRDGRLVLSARSAGPGPTRWVLRTPGYAFAGSGVVIDGGGSWRCAVEGSRQAARCAPAARSAQGASSYRLTVVATDGSAPPDPPAINPVIQHE
jgi:hypothetical protein